MSKAGKRLIAGMEEAVAIARGERPAASVHMQGHSYVPKQPWRPDLNEAPLDKPVLLLLGETIPDVPNIRVGTRISADAAEQLGYREYAKYGGFLLWNDGADFYVIDLVEPSRWMPVP